MATGPDENDPDALRKRGQRLSGVNRDSVSAAQRGPLIMQGMEAKLRREGVQGHEKLVARLAQRLGGTIQRLRRKFGKANGSTADLKDTLPQVDRSGSNSGIGLPEATTRSKTSRIDKDKASETARGFGAFDVERPQSPEPADPINWGLRGLGEDWPDEHSPTSPPTAGRLWGSIVDRVAPEDARSARGDLEANKPNAELGKYWESIIDRVAPLSPEEIAAKRRRADLIKEIDKSLLLPNAESHLMRELEGTKLTVKELGLWDGREHSGSVFYAGESVVVHVGRGKFQLLTPSDLDEVTLQKLGTTGNLQGVFLKRQQAGEAHTHEPRPGSRDQYRGR